MKILKRLKLFLMAASVMTFVSCEDNQNTATESAPSMLEEDNYNVGILIMEGVYNTEVTAPYDIFQHTKFRKGIKKMNVFTVSQKGDLIPTFEGMKMVSDYSFNDVPSIDILVIPAAEGHLGKDLENEVLVDWVKEVSREAMFVTSHCDGAFLLAKSGLPDSTHVTTFPGDREELRQMFPKLNVHDDVLFVHDGKYITGVGGARSFEAALYLCDLLYGPDKTNELAKGMVLDWPIKDMKYLKVD